jgi:rhomboid protease GluP
MTLGALWVLVFVAMIVYQAAFGPGVRGQEVVLGRGSGHVFGDMTLGELYDGQVWRAVTATFVHYGVVHIGINLYALYQLGCLVESWYGPGPFVAIYVLTGGAGNLLSGIVRRALHWDPGIPSAGGSVVIMGLVGLCAVVGWRSETRLGRHLRNQMVWVLGLTGAIGLALPLFGLPIMDNWGHACGAAVGAAIGLANRAITMQVGRPLARWAGRLGSLVLAASAAAQVVDDRQEALHDRQDALRRLRVMQEARQRLAADDQHLFLIEEVRQLYRTVSAPRAVLRGALIRSLPDGGHRANASGTPEPSGSPDPARALYDSVVQASFHAFESLRAPLDTGATSSDYRRAFQLLKQSLVDPPSLEELREFDDRMVALRDAVQRDRNLALARSLARPE